jgi:hypothetical protein
VPEPVPEPDPELEPLLFDGLSLFVFVSAGFDSLLLLSLFDSDFGFGDE